MKGSGKSGHPARYSVSNHDSEIRANEGTKSTLLTFFHVIAFGGKISPRIYLLGKLENLGRAEFYANSTAFAVFFFDI